jgi:hypothetical protein
MLVCRTEHMGLVFAEVLGNLRSTTGVEHTNREVQRCQYRSSRRTGQVRHAGCWDTTTTRVAA